MTPDVIAALPGILTIAADHGEKLRGQRSLDRKLSFDPQLDVYYSFEKGGGGGKIDYLADEILGGVSRREALAYGAAKYGVPLDIRPDPMAARRRAAARSQARDLARWRWGLVQGLKGLAIAIRRDVRAVSAWTAGQTGWSEHPNWKRYAQTRERWRLADALDAYIRHLEALPARELIALRRRLEAAR